MNRSVVLGFLIVVGVSSGSEDRDPRWFGKQTRTIVKTFKTSRVVVETTPSSCVVVEDNLPPCRHLRSFWPFATATSRIAATKPPTLQKSYEEHAWKPVAASSKAATPPLRASADPSLLLPPPPPPSAATWDWDVFNLAPRDVTVTKTIEQIHTTKVFDPNTVVTFSVKGCRPSRLPFDLAECPAPTPATQSVPEKSVIVMAPVQLVPSAEPHPATETEDKQPAIEPSQMDPAA